MARASTRLTACNLAEFSGFLEDSRPPLLWLSSIDFRTLDEVDEADYQHQIQLVKNCLKEYGISSSNVMVSKILLGVTGQCVALDRFFRATYKRLYVENPNHIHDVLVNLKKSYIRTWKKELSKLPAAYRTTRAGKGIPVPIARQIDIAFWWAGRQEGQQKSL